jgi:hypothetical protein
VAGYAGWRHTGQLPIRFRFFRAGAYWVHQGVDRSWSSSYLQRKPGFTEVNQQSVPSVYQAGKSYSSTLNFGVFRSFRLPCFGFEPRLSSETPRPLGGCFAFLLSCSRIPVLTTGSCGR